MPSAPERDVLFEVSRALHHGSGDGPMDVDFPVTDILQDAGISRGLATFVVMLGESVHRDSHPASRQPDEVLRNWDYSTGHD